MNFRLGLQGRFMLAILAGLMVVGGLAATLWQRQTRAFAEMAQVSSETVHELTFDALERRGRQLASDLSLQLVNPMYFVDLEQIAERAAAAGRQPGVSSVLVFDDQLRIVHDGTPAVLRYGERIRDNREKLGSEVQVQWGDGVMEVRTAIMLADDVIGGLRITFDLAGVQVQQRTAQQRLAERQAAATSTYRIWLAGLLGLLGLLGVVVSWLVSRGLVAPIRVLADAARDIEAGRYRQIHLASSRNDEMGELIRSFARMADGVEKHEREVRRIAYTDSLTGLPNRLALREMLDIKLLAQSAGGSALVLMFIDLDDFKRVNDTMGHEAGDRVLIQLADRIREHAGKAAGVAVQVARFGGDEFVAVMECDEPRLRAARVADAIIDALLAPVRLRGREQFLGASIGITVFPDDARSASQLIKNGDIAMYQAKLAGKNCYRFYSRALDDAMADRVQLEHDLRGALEREELKLYYQPVVSTNDHTLCGVEALLRWEHPARGLLMPAEFIDVAEQGGLISTIGAYALARACGDMATLSSSHAAPDLFVSVNVSARQMRSGDLVGHVASALATSGLTPTRLRLELTETAVLSDETLAISQFARLRATGVRVWLDDFGTGFSGLSHLRRVPVDGVKIDRSFVADLLDDPDDVALTSAIIALAHSLGIGVVAEGVEDLEQLRVLSEHGCEMVQGFLIAKAMPLSMLRDWIAHRAALGV
jgi:diguanylate cyclase (GGDEF)-like protein